MSIFGLAVGRQALAAEASDQTKVWLHKARPQLQADHVREEVLKLPFTGKALHRVKAQDNASLSAGQPTVVAAAFDGDGNALPDDGKALQAAEWSAEWQARGGIQPALWQHLQEVDRHDRIPVAIWLRENEPPPMPRGEAGNPYAMETDMAAREAARDTAKAAFLAQAAEVVGAPFSAQAGVPVVSADLTIEEITAVAWLPRLGWIDWARPYEQQAIRSSWYSSAMADPVVTGKYGADITMCVIENRLYQYPGDAPGAPKPTENPTVWWDKSAVATSFAYRNTSDGQHARAILGALQSTATPNGYAPSAHIYFANWEYSYSLPEAGYWCSGDHSYGPAYVWNYSYACNLSLCPALVDYWGSHAPWPMITIPSGNITSGTHAVVKNLAWNSLTVGGSNDIDTAMSRSDDVADPNSADLNPTIDGRTDWELPNVVAPSLEQIADGQTDYTAGTSLSSAEVAGIAVQVMQTDTLLKQWPEPVRAIIMCSADQDVDGGRLSMTDAVDDRDGAGEVDGLLAVQMADPANIHAFDTAGTWRGYDFGSLCDAALGCIGPSAVPAMSTWSHVYHMKWDPTVAGNPSLQSPRMRVVLTWAAHATCTNATTANASCANDATHNINADIDLHVYRHSDHLQVAGGLSNTFRSNWEFVEFVPAAGELYDVELYVYSWSSIQTYYGIAWNTGIYPAN